MFKERVTERQGLQNTKIARTTTAAWRSNALFFSSISGWIGKRNSNRTCYRVDGELKKVCTIYFDHLQKTFTLAGPRQIYHTVSEPRIQQGAAWQSRLPLSLQQLLRFYDKYRSPDKAAS